MINKDILKSLINISIIFIAWNIIIYFLFSFVLWELNPQLWSENSRLTYSMFGGFIGLSIAIGIITVNNK